MWFILFVPKKKWINKIYITFILSLYKMSWISLKHFISLGDFSYKKLILWFSSCKYSRNCLSVTWLSIIVLFVCVLSIKLKLVNQKIKVFTANLNRYSLKILRNKIFVFYNHICIVFLNAVCEKCDLLQKY